MPAILRKNFLPLFLLFMGVFFSACKKDQKANWGVDVLAPLINTSLSLNDLIADSLTNTQTDGALELVYSYEASLDSFSTLVDVQDTFNEVSVKMEKLVLSDQSYKDTITLREISPQAAILHGQTLPLPAQHITNPNIDDEIDLSTSFFEDAYINEGSLELRLDNDLPVEIELIKAKMSNVNLGTVILDETFTNIPAMGSFTKSIDLAGKEIEGNIRIEVTEIKTKGSSGPVYIDADKGLRLEMSIKDLKPYRATAVFPAQNLVSDSVETVYPIEGGNITGLLMKGGYVSMEIISTLEEELILTYEVPNSTVNGDPNVHIKQEVRVPPAKKGETSSKSVKWTLEGREISYQGKDKSTPPHFNTVYSILTARIEYSGVKRTLSLNDSVRIRYGFAEVDVDYGFGAFDKNTYASKDTLNVNMFKNVEGKIDLEEASMDIRFENTFGIEADFEVNNITGINTRSGVATQLSAIPLQGVKRIQPATNPPLTPGVYADRLDNTNSNLRQFLGNLPDKISTDLNIVASPEYAHNLDEFIFYFSDFKMLVDFKLPLTVAPDNLRLQKAMPLNADQLNQIDGLKSGSFKLGVTNGFPFEVNVQLEFLDENGKVLFAAFPNGPEIAMAGQLGNDGKVNNPTQSTLTIELDEAKMDMLKQAKSYRPMVGFNAPDNIKRTLYSDYTIDLKLIGDFTYEQTY